MEINTNIKKLSILDITDNQFTGESSLVLLNLTTDISNNLFKSTLPADMSRFHNLVNFVCGWQVGNSFLDLFLHLRSWFLHFTGNKFNGPIKFRNTSSSSNLQNLFPKSISKFTKSVWNSFSKFICQCCYYNLELVDISGNQLEGKLPQSLTNCNSLKFVNVESNKIIDKFRLGWVLCRRYKSWFSGQMNSTGRYIILMCQLVSKFKNHLYIA